MLAQDYNTVPPVRFEPATPLRVKYFFGDKIICLLLPSYVIPKTLSSELYISCDTTASNFLAKKTGKFA